MNRLIVKIERKKTNGQIVQYHRCQLFGHVQKNYNAEFHCIKCADSHNTHLCPKETATPKKCLNSGDTHTTVWRNCKSILKTRQHNTGHKKRMQFKTENNKQELNTKAKVATQLGNMFLLLNNTDSNKNKKRFSTHITP